MSFDIKKTQNRVWELLSGAIDKNRIGSAYLFSGPAGIGKEAMAIEFGAEINRNYWKEDQHNGDLNYDRFKSLNFELLKIIVPLPVGKASKETSDPLKSLTQADLNLLKENIENKSINPFHKIILPGATRIRIDSIRELRKTLYLKSDDVGRKIVLIFDAHLLSVGQAESANALLKILEEPPANTTLILVTDRKNLLLPTILSRCQHTDFPLLSSEIVAELLQENNIDNESSKVIAGISQGNIHRALNLSENTVDEIINRIQKLSYDVITSDGKKWRKFINDNAKLVRSNIEQFQFNLFLLQLWFKAVYRLKNGVGDELQRPELMELMESFNKQYPNTNFQKININIEEALDAVGRNLYMSLILTNLLINIQRNIQQ